MAFGLLDTAQMLGTPLQQGYDMSVRVIPREIYPRTPYSPNNYNNCLFPISLSLFLYSSSLSNLALI